MRPEMFLARPALSPAFCVGQGASESNKGHRSAEQNHVGERKGRARLSRAWIFRPEVERPPRLASPHRREKLADVRVDLRPLPHRRWHVADDLVGVGQVLNPFGLGRCRLRGAVGR